jgi:hypothetical protein
LFTAPICRGGGHGGRTVARLADYLHVVLCPEDPAQPLADEHVIVRDQDQGAVCPEANPRTAVSRITGVARVLLAVISTVPGL